MLLINNYKEVKFGPKVFRPYNPYIFTSFILHSYFMVIQAYTMYLILRQIIIDYYLLLPKKRITPYV